MIGARSSSRSTISRLACALALALAAPAALCQTISVLWYTYAHPSSDYRHAIRKFAAAGANGPP